MTDNPAKFHLRETNSNLRGRSGSSNPSPVRSKPSDGKDRPAHAPVPAIILRESGVGGAGVGGGGWVGGGGLGGLGVTGGGGCCKRQRNNYK